MKLLCFEDFAKSNWALAQSAGERTAGGRAVRVLNSFKLCPIGRQKCYSHAILRTENSGNHCQRSSCVESDVLLE